jgi:carbonic anhydrase
MSRSSWDVLVDAHHSVDTGADGETPHHAPNAAVLACSDARVPPSVIFNQPAGNLFVIRIAGNTAVPSVLASLDYAVASLGVDLIVVMGHTNCGAVRAATEGTCGGYLAPIVGSICAIAAAFPDVAPDRVAELNVAHTVEAIANHDGPAGEAFAAGRLEIRGAMHILETGYLKPVADIDHTQSSTLMEQI